MRTETVLVAAVVVLGVLALGSTAASYDDAAEPVSVGANGEAGASGGEGSGGLAGGGETGSSALPALPGWLSQYLVVLTFGLGTLLFVLGSIAITWLRGVDGLKRVLSMIGEAALGGALYVGVVGFLVWLIFGFSGQGIELAGGPAESGGPRGGSGVDEAAGSDARSVPYWYVLIAIWTLMGVGWYFLFHRGSDEDEPSAVDPGSEDSGATANPADTGVGRNETVSDVPPSNTVYEAWREMAAEAAEATDGTLTANEVAAAADERGLDGEAVRALTRLFEEVRYGDRPVTEERERRAESALDSLEGSGGRGA